MREILHLGITSTLQSRQVKVYVKGYEIEKPVITFKDIAKARDFETVNAGTVNNELGNFVKVTNLYNQPNITSISGETVPYKELQLHDDVIATRSTAGPVNKSVLQERDQLNIVLVLLGTLMPFITYICLILDHSLT